MHKLNRNTTHLYPTKQTLFRNCIFVMQVDFYNTKYSDFAIMTDDATYVFERSAIDEFGEFDSRPTFADGKPYIRILISKANIVC